VGVFFISDNLIAEVLPPLSQHQCSFFERSKRGHINAESGLGDWHEGHALLLDCLSSQT
jgi:predicted alpha/beta hydrolase family esterase